MVIVALVLGCSGPGDSDGDTGPRDVLAEVTTAGPWRAGYRQTTVAYDDPAGDGTRTLALAVWYPTTAVTGTEVRYNGLVSDPDALGDAPIAEGAFPIAVFSHGHQGYAENSSFLMTHLASHGWLVLAPDHFGNTTFDGSDRTTAIYVQRPRDLSAVLDWAQDPPADDPIRGHVADPIVGFGHSFGGYTAFALAGAAFDPAVLAACGSDGDVQPFCSTMTAEYAAMFAAGLEDSRIVGVVAMASGDYGLFHDAGVAAVDVPVLHLTAENDSAPNDAYWAPLAGGVHRRVQILDAGHQSFTDLSGLIDEEPIDPAEGWRIVDGYALAFAEQMRGDAAMAAILDGDVVVSELAVVSR